MHADNGLLQGLTTKYSIMQETPTPCTITTSKQLPPPVSMSSTGSIYHYTLMHADNRLLQGVTTKYSIRKHPPHVPSLQVSNC